MHASHYSVLTDVLLHDCTLCMYTCTCVFSLCFGQSIWNCSSFRMQPIIRVITPVHMQASVVGYWIGTHQCMYMCVCTFLHSTREVINTFTTPSCTTESSTMFFTNRTDLQNKLYAIISPLTSMTSIYMQNKLYTIISPLTSMTNTCAYTCT